MVQLGIANSRMKDFFDLWMLSRRFEFDGATLAKAISTTFRRRKCPVPEDVPIALTREFSQDPLKSNQWSAFLRRHRLQTGTSPLPQLVEELAQFLIPPMQGISKSGNACHPGFHRGPGNSPTSPTVALPDRPAQDPGFSRSAEPRHAGAIPAPAAGGAGGRSVGIRWSLPPKGVE
jgi:hypothetical protein